MNHSSIIRLRSMLFVPGNRPDRFDKAALSGADAIILDLEDGVAADAKAEAREAVAIALRAGLGLPVYVRVNPVASPQCLADLSAIVPCAPDGLVLPKTEGPMDVACIDWAIGQLGGAPQTMEILPSIESAAALNAIGEVAGASTRVRRIGLGLGDLGKDLGLSPDGPGMDAVRVSAVVASRAAGLAPPIDGVFADIKDSEGLATAAARARSFGFGGKRCIHPAQVASVNAAFAPTEAELHRARRIAAEADRRGDAPDAFALDGQMIDAPIIAQARAMIAEAGA